MDIVVRLARKDDSQGITTLTNELGYPSAEKKVQEILDMVLKHDDHQLFIAEIGGELVAYIHLVCTIRIGSEPFIEIAAFIVHHDYQKKGVGKKLIHETENFARARGYKAIRIRSNIIREEAHAFFNARGFNNLKTQEVFMKQLGT